MNKQKNNAIHFTLFKIIGVYQMIDPSTRTIFGKNVYHLVHITLMILTLIMTIFGLSGFFFKIRDTYENIDFDRIIIIFYLICISIGSFKTIMIIINADKIWGLLNVSNERFLSSRHSKNHFYKVVKCGNRLSKFFNGYFCLMIITITLYAMMPIIINYHIATNKTPHGEMIRKINIINLKYPITTEIYNAFYVVFYIMECILLFFVAYGIFAFDLFAMTFLMIISVQYEVLALAFEDLEEPVNSENGSSSCKEDLQENILSIISDCQNIFKKLKIVLDVTRPVALTQVPADGTGMIFMPYLIILSYQKNGSFLNTETVKFLLTLAIAGVQSFMYCSLFQRIIDKKESLNFRLYCCDWTKMDIEIKKIILFKMRLNNSSNYLKMKVTPTKCIDLPFLAYIIRSSYTILSVMINKGN